MDVQPDKSLATPKLYGVLHAVSWLVAALLLAAVAFAASQFIHYWDAISV